MKVGSPDYKGQDPEEAAKDFMLRIKNYELAYQTLDNVEDKWDYTNSLLNLMSGWYTQKSELAENFQCWSALWG